MKKRGLLVVVSSPSGGGKGTILKELFRRNENLKMSVSATTRAPRPGRNTACTITSSQKTSSKRTSKTMRCSNMQNIATNFITARRKRRLKSGLKEGRDVVLEIEVQGGRQIKKVAPDCVSLFILPPSLKVLEKRLRGRGTETRRSYREAPRCRGRRDPLRKRLRLRRHQRHGRTGRA